MPERKVEDREINLVAILDAERDRARDLAVALESEIARLHDITIVQWSVIQKLFRQIIELPPESDEDITPLPYSREDIAELAGSSDQCIGRLLATLYREERRKLYWLDEHNNAIAERNSILREARALMRHSAECQLLGTHWVWDVARQQSFCRACRAAYNVETPGHRHDCDCGRNALVARIDALIGGEGASRG